MMMQIKSMEFIKNDFQQNGCLHSYTLVEEGPLTITEIAEYIGHSQPSTS